VSHNVELPQHRYVFVVPSFVLRPDDPRTALIPAVWVGCSVQPGRALGCTVLLESGALVVDLPLHALRGAFVTWAPLELPDVVAWDCYGWSAEIWEPSYLSGLPCAILTADHKHATARGSLWFAVDHVGGDGFSLAPDQHKLLYVVERQDDHALMLLPQDRLVIEEASFTVVEGIPAIRRQTQVWTAER
jgi:hypothetical protein